MLLLIRFKLNIHLLDVFCFSIYKSSINIALSQNISENKMKFNEYQLKMNKSVWSSRKI